MPACRCDVWSTADSVASWTPCKHALTNAPPACMQTSGVSAAAKAAAARMLPEQPLSPAAAPGYRTRSQTRAANNLVDNGSPTHDTSTEQASSRQERAAASPPAEAKAPASGSRHRAHSEQGEQAVDVEEGELKTLPYCRAYARRPLKRMAIVVSGHCAGDH